MPSIADRYALDFLLRPRVVARLADASMRPIVLLAAGAGWGKSVALDQYLQSLGHGYRRFDVARKELAIANIDTSVAGVVAIDGLERAPASVIAALVSVIERSKQQIQWVVATRSLVGLPVGTWLANHDCDLPIAASDLRFTFEEALECIREHVGVSDREIVREIIDTTDGWPMAIAVAFRTLRQTSDIHEVRASIRDAAFHYLSEQVYPDLEDGERELLSVAAVLTEININVLEHAGFSNAHRVLDTIRSRTGLLTGPDADSFFMPRLLREYLNRQTALEGAPKRAAVNRRAAQALEVTGNKEGALAAYGTAHSQSDLLRILEGSGFDLLERGRVDCVSQAIDTLDEQARRSNPRVLALRGVLQSLAGKPIRAETLLRRSLAHADDDRDLIGFAGLRLAPLIANYSGDASDVLTKISGDPRQQSAFRVEALSLLAVAQAVAHKKSEAEGSLMQVDSLLHGVDQDSIRARVLQRVGVAAMQIGKPEDARRSLTHAAELATELNLHGVASRAWSALSNLFCHIYDDVASQLRCAEQACDAANRSGDRLGLQTAWLQVAAAEMRRGNGEKSAALEEHLLDLLRDPVRSQLLVSFKALRLGWQSRFGDAHRLLFGCWDQMYHDFDRVVSGAQCALFLALDGRRDASIRLLSKVSSLSEDVQAEGIFRSRCIAIALLFCVVAEVVNQRVAVARKIAKRLDMHAGDDAIFIVSRLASRYTHAHPGFSDHETFTAYERLKALGYADAVLVLEAACAFLRARDVQKTSVSLTTAEISVLKYLSEGLSTKEIAEREDRSIFTVRAHIANAIGKLRCRGRSQAVAFARKLDLIP